MFFSTKKKQITSDRPMNIIMCLEESCNLHCIQCDIWHTRVIALRLTIEQRKKTIINLKKWLGNFTLNIFAGEPLIHPQIFELISFASSNGIKTVITTNGVMLNDLIINKIINAGLYGLYVSLDGINADTHDQIRGVTGTHDRVIKGIKKVTSLGKDGPRVIIETLIMKNNIQEIIPMIDFASELGAKGVIFQPVTSKYGFGSSEYNKLWHMSEENLLPSPNHAILIVEKIISKKRNGSSVMNSYDQLENAKSYFRDPEYFALHSPCCAAQNFVITDSGEILLCFSQKAIGTIELPNFQSIWNGKLASEVRRNNLHCNKTSKILNCYSMDIGKNFESAS